MIPISHSALLKVWIPGTVRRIGLGLASFLIFFLLPAVCWETKNTCLDCHSALDEPLRVTTEEFTSNIHAQKGLTCASCHGGDPSSDDEAMSPKAGFRGKIDRKQIPELCGKCHADAAYIRQYNPSLRTDQLAQYRTSVHGQKFQKGDSRVAVCTDCHGIHGIRPASDARSTVNPLRVATTCSRCHADPNYMKPYGIKTTQFADYSKSVHHEAMTARGDLSAPTCTTCHGNHGAAPPGVATVINVCSTCHVYQSQLFESSPHKAAFASAGLPGCVTCHSNHQIVHPNDEMVSQKENSICLTCHAEGDAGFQTAGNIHNHLLDLDSKIARSKTILDRAAESGMEVSQPQLDLIQAADSLTKARVAVHSFRAEKVAQETASGQVVTEKTYRAGAEALHERDKRRLGLSISLIFIAVSLAGLKLWMREIESDKPPKS
jgi:predicted CXXCH cytochrome family protein